MEMCQKMEMIFRFLNFLDTARWANELNYDIPNYCIETISPAEKLLTHFFCYFSDRGIAFEQVFEKAAFIYSNLAVEYSRTKASLDELLNPESGKSFL